MHHILFYTLLASRGGPTRASIVKELLEKPQNSNQLASTLELDYKTIQHHMRILEKNNVIGVINKGGYGAMFYVQEDCKTYLEENRDEFGKTFINENR